MIHRTITVTASAVAAVCLSTLVVFAGNGQATSAGLGTVPPPTGPFSVGRVTVHWADSSRIEPLAPNHGPRELMVDIWYPAEPTAAAVAEYLDASVFERVLGAPGFRRQFAGASDAVKAGGVHTHAVVGALFAHSANRSPVLVFSPGGGMVREVYAAQLEDLASHGYVVAAISHTYDAALVVFPDGRGVVYDSKRWPAPPSLEGESNLNQLEWHARDIRFVLDELSRANAIGVSSLPFAGHLDLTRAGALGHSFGGIAAAHACQLDRRLKACLNQDGLVSMQPFYLDARGWGMDQPFMLIQIAPRRDPLTDEDLAAMKVTRRQAEELVAKLTADQAVALRSTGKGSYHVLLQNSTAMHMDFSDLPVLGARDDSEEKMRAHIIAIVRSYTLAFFDKSLRGRKVPLLDRKASDDLVVAVRRLATAKRPF